MTTTVGISAQKEIELKDVASMILTGMPGKLGGFEIETYRVI